MTTPIDFLLSWFKAQADGDWEHDLGIRIATLDNPGWSVSIRIEDTALEGSVTTWHRDEESDSIWLHWGSDGLEFKAYCGIEDLPRALEAFQYFVAENAE